MCFYADHTDNATDLFFESVSTNVKNWPEEKRIKFQVDVMQLLLSAAQEKNS